MSPPKTATTSASRAAAAILAAAAMLATLPAAAETEAQLDQARQRLGELERRLNEREAQVDRLHAQLEALTRQVGRQQSEVGAVRDQLRATEERLEQTRGEIRDLRERIQVRARAVYMRGPVRWLDIVLGAQSLSEFGDRVVYAARLIREDGDLVLRMRKAEAELDVQRAEKERLIAEEAAKLSALRGEQRSLRTVFASHMARLGELAALRAEALSLVDMLKDRLAAEELEGIRRVAGKGMPITFGQWAAAFLSTLGAPASRNNMVVVVAWEVAEYTKATWNPLATTMAAPGATVYNSHGVKNYVSKEQGIEATIRTLRLPNRGYEPILANLRASSEPMRTAEAINASRWCSGCAGGTYVTGLIPTVQEHYDRYANS